MDKKEILKSVVKVASGLLIGAVAVYGYYNFSILGRFYVDPADLSAATAYLKFKDLKNSFYPRGIPSVYGQELGISFDEVQDAINKVAKYDPTYGSEKIILEDADKRRYTKIGLQIACEYCCAAKTLVSEDGEAACGCDHSQMMRGLTAYIVKNHPDMSDKNILQELTEWKKTYFPRQMFAAELQDLKKRGDTAVEGIINEFPDFLPSMVGKC